MRRGQVPDQPVYTNHHTRNDGDDTQRDAPRPESHVRGVAAIPITLSARDEAILQAIARLQFVTAQQIVQLFYQPGSLEYVRSRLKRLADHQYLLRLRLPSANSGNTPWVYAVATSGWTYLRAAGMLSADEDLSLRFRPAEHHTHSWFFLTHSLAVTDILIAALLLPARHPEVVIRDLRHERVLRRQPSIRVTTQRGETVRVIGDGFVDVVLGGALRMSILLELDRGTMAQRAMLEKFRGLLAYAAGPYQRVFRSASLTFAIATTAGQQRCNALRGWCERALAEIPDDRHRKAYADLFLFTALPPVPAGSGALNPDALFLQPIWSQPFADRLAPLLDFTG
jgi:hypothetical protein